MEIPGLCLHHRHIHLRVSRGQLGRIGGRSQHLPRRQTPTVESVPMMGDEKKSGGLAFRLRAADNLSTVLMVVSCLVVLL